MRRYEREQQGEARGISIPVFLVIWVVCSAIAGESWYSIAGGSTNGQTTSFVTWLVLAVGFGFGGAGLIWLAADIVRQP